MNIQALYVEAEHYFVNLWQQSRSKWLCSEVSAASMADGVPVPVDYILTTVGRLVDQLHAPLEAVQSVMDQLSEVGAGQFFYPLCSTHISLVGCTQRYPSKDVFSAERIEKIYRVCAKVLLERGTTKMILRGVGVIGNQVFIQVFPQDRKWEVLRQELELELIANGETPIAYPNKAPIHMNIMRVTDNEPIRLSRILEVVDQLRNIEIGELEVSVVEFMVTDFVLSSASTLSLGRFTLSHLSDTGWS